jgi:hypothetical protein
MSMAAMADTPKQRRRDFTKIDRLLLRLALLLYLIIGLEKIVITENILSPLLLVSQ